jgi:ribosomal-protein-alanine N-acetyltransferase
MLDLTPIFADFPVLHTERLTLRAVTMADALPIFEMLRDPQVVRYLAQPPMTALGDAARRVAIYQHLYEEQKGIQWAIANRADGYLLGTCVFWHLEPLHYRAEVGYTLASAYWRQGIMSEAVSAVLDFGFGTMGLHSVEARTDPANAASNGLLEKLGFVREAYFRENYFDPVAETFTDTAVYSLLKADWLARGDADQ